MFLQSCSVNAPIENRENENHGGRGDWVGETW